jgi:hypothetical protein
MGAWLLNFFTGGAVGSILGPLKDGLLQAQQQYYQAQNDQQKLAAQEAMAIWQGQIDLAIQASKTDKWYSIRNLIGYCVTLYIFKIIVLDTVFQLGSTPNPGTQVTFIVMTVVGFFFASKAAESVAQTIAAAISRKP